ncbi:hypothetical protein tb265_47030 [Gemmatimonadetes bacterium T265]|nr:hypothetical protein tb265_47030 [Gemmatimonadetes bacterium T265]
MAPEVIGFTIRNLPAILLVAALVAAAIRRGREPAVGRLLSWVLLLPIGVTGLWAGISHVCFPDIAAAHIGWRVSPFQFEVGVADLAIGVTACLAFRRALAFQAAALSAASIFLLGDAVGHVRQMIVAGNFAPGNAGVPFYMDVIAPVLGLTLLTLAHRGRTHTAVPASAGHRFA